VNWDLSHTLHGPSRWQPERRKRAGLPVRHDAVVLAAPVRMDQYIRF
jgi:hypothetical protein